MLNINFHPTSLAGAQTVTLFSVKNNLGNRMNTHSSMMNAPWLQEPEDW